MSRAPLLIAALLLALVAAPALAGEPVAFGRTGPAATAFDPTAASTAQLASLLWGSLYSEVSIAVPDELKRRVGELAAMTTDLDPRVRVQGSFALALIGRGEVLTRTAYEPVVGSPSFERANAAFLRCAVQQDCQRAVQALRKLGAVPLKSGKPAQLDNVDAVLLLSLIQQDGYAAYVDSLKTKDPGQRAALAVAKQRHATTFPPAR